MRERYAIECNCLSSPYWESFEPNVKSNAFVYKKNGFEESAYIRIGADVNAFLSVSKASLAFSFHTNLSFLVRQVNGATILE